MKITELRDTMYWRSRQCRGQGTTPPRNPWQPWWAWHPVRVNGRWRWGTWVYRQHRYVVFRRYGNWIYGDLFDYLRWTP